MNSKNINYDKKKNEKHEFRTFITLIIDKTIDIMKFAHLYDNKANL